MRPLVVFQQLSLDGYFVDRNCDMTWAKNDHDEEFNAFTSENAKGGGVLLFGRVTYELMSNFWPAPQAHQSPPVVAERMLPKSLPAPPGRTDCVVSLTRVLGR